MSKIKFSENLFLEKQELNRFKEFIDDNGFRKFLLSGSSSFGFVKKENESFSNGLIQEDVGLTIKHNAIEAIDGRILNKAALLKSLSVVNATYGAGYVANLSLTSTALALT